MLLASFKLRFADRHVRIVPREHKGCAFLGPGVDLRGGEADPIFAAAAPMMNWLHEREPNAKLRSLSFDLEKLRVLITIDDPALKKPRVLRIDPPASTELYDLAKALLVELGESAEKMINARA